MEECNNDPRCKFYQNAMIWMAFLPVTLVLTIGGAVAVFKPELFGF